MLNVLGQYLWYTPWFRQILICPIVQMRKKISHFTPLALTVSRKYTSYLMSWMEHPWWHYCVRHVHLDMHWTCVWHSFCVSVVWCDHSHCVVSVGPHSKSPGIAATIEAHTIEAHTDTLSLSVASLTFPTRLPTQDLAYVLVYLFFFSNYPIIS